MRDLDPDLIAESYLVGSGSAWTWLVEFELNNSETLRINSGAESIDYDGKTWDAFPFRLGTLEDDASGNLGGVSIVMPNQWLIYNGTEMTVAQFVDMHDGFEDKSINLWVHNSKDGFAIDLGSFGVDSVQSGVQSVNFQLGQEDIVNLHLPGRRVSRDCRKTYKASNPDDANDGTFCGYAGALATCDKTLDGSNGCREHGKDSALHPLRFGGFPGLRRP